MGKYVLYSHAGSENHGCEALLRTTVHLIDDVESVYSMDVVADQRYQLDQIVKIKNGVTDGFDNKICRLIYLILYRITKNDKLYYLNRFRGFIRELDSKKVYLSIGGDNYCYHYNVWLEVLNKAIHRSGAKSILWGCSVNADALTDKGLLHDLNYYTLITARESITFNLLREALPKSKIELVPDTAFMLPAIYKALPRGFEPGNTIGLNFSPVSVSNSKQGERLIDYYSDLVDYIIDHTSYQIALIPHVVQNNNDDRKVMRLVVNKCKDSSRIVFVEDDNCMVLKGYIARCELFVGARTHSTIAAYSSYVPTLVLGYSVKAKGIAMDLFGSSDSYVLPVQTIQSSQEIIDHFVWLNDNKQMIKEKLESVIPRYIERISKGREYLLEV